MPVHVVLRRKALHSSRVTLAASLLLVLPASAQVGFESLTPFPKPASAAIADVNGDGFLDVCGKEFGSPVVYAG
jgi:hypothetical protein